MQSPRWEVWCELADSRFAIHDSRLSDRPHRGEELHRRREIAVADGVIRLEGPRAARLQVADDNPVAAWIHTDIPDGDCGAQYPATDAILDVGLGREER